MKLRIPIATGIFTSLALCLCLLPSHASAQAGPGGGGGGGGRGGGMGGMAVVQQIRQVMPQLDLTDDQKGKIQDILKQAMQDARDSMQGMQDATPEERRAKMQDMQKLFADAKGKVEAELTPEQKAKYYPLMANAGVKQMTDLIAALKTAVTSQKIPDDNAKQLNSVFDDSQKTLDGMKDDANAVKDADGSKDFQTKLTGVQIDLRKQVVDILGQDDSMKLMQAARQSMRPGGPRAGANGDAAPTTAPADK